MRRLSLAARVTWLCVGVALVAALLTGFATAAWIAAQERAAAAHVTRERPLHRAAARAATHLVHSGELAVGVGLLVGALAGVVAAGALTSPLRRTRDAARALAEGSRDVRVPVEGPPEIAELAADLNALAEALAASEGRQRRFLLSVSHELRTPLTAVRGFAESIADGVVEGDDARAAGGVILAESARLERLVRDLLDLARLGSDDFRLDVVDVDVAAVLDDAAHVWQNRTPALRVERPGAPLHLWSDGARVRQVLDALIDNAVRVTPPGRPVVIAARTPGPDDPSGTRAVLEVRDGGPGLAAEDRAVAFEPGALGARYRDERPVGVGIGLSLVHGLVARLGGAIAVGDAPEGGARFTIVLGDAPAE